MAAPIAVATRCAAPAAEAVQEPASDPLEVHALTDPLRAGDSVAPVQRTKKGGGAPPNAQQRRANLLESNAGVAQVDAATLGQVVGWSDFGGLVELGRAFVANNGGLTAADWLAAANAHANVIDQAADLAGLVRAVGANGTGAGIAGLVTAAIGHNAGTTLPQLTAMVAASPAANVCAGLTTLVNTVAANSTVPQITAVITAAIHHNAGTSLANLDALVQASPAANVCVGLLALVNAVAARGTIPHLTNLVVDAIANNAGTTLAELRALVLAGPANGTIADLRQLVTDVAANDTIPHLTTLITRALLHNAATTLGDLSALVTASPAAANVCTDLTTLVNRVAANGTVPQTTTLVTAAIGHNAATTIAQLAALVQAGGNGANIVTQLTALVNAIAANGTVVQTTALVARAVLTLGQGNTADLLPLINANAAQNTPPRVQALLTALGNGARARFNTIEPKIHQFSRTPAPPNVTDTWNVHGHTFRCNNYSHFRERHTYEYFDFAQIAAVQSIWPLGTNPRTALGTEMGGISNADAATLSGGWAQIASGNQVIGTNGGGVWITQFYPVGAADESFNQAEMTAIEHLR